MFLLIILLVELTTLKLINNTGVTNVYSTFPIDNELAQDPDEPYFTFSIYVYELNRLYERSDVKTRQLLSEIFKIFFYHFLTKDIKKREREVKGEE